MRLESNDEDVDLLPFGRQYSYDDNAEINEEHDESD